MRTIGHGQPETDLPNTALRIAHLTTTNDGGAGIAVERLHAALQNIGHNSKIFMHYGSSWSEGHEKFETTSSRTKLAISKAFFKLSTEEKYYFRNAEWRNPAANAIYKAISTFAPDIIISHFTSGFMSFQEQSEISKSFGTPILFYLMDMNPLTGGCHFAWDCRGYERECASCPAVTIKHLRAFAKNTLTKKTRAIDGLNHSVVAGSSWLAAQAMRSSIFGASKVDIAPLGLDPAIFRPMDQEAARVEFGLESGRPMLFFGSRKNEQMRKGVPLLKAALQLLATQLSKDRLPLLLVAGDGPDFREFTEAGYQVKNLGPVPPEQLIKAYSAATIYISPSIEDAGPMMINESVMCGCLVVANPLGVALDIVEDGGTGRISKTDNDPDHFSEAILDVLSWGEDRIVKGRSRARELALERLTADAQAGAISALVRELQN